MKNKILSTLLFLSFPLLTSAQNLKIPDSVSQGSTLEIKIPALGLEKISGVFEDQKFHLQKKNKPKNISEFITRAEFMHLIIQNLEKNKILKKEDLSPKISHKNINFSDLKNSHKYYEDILNAAEKNIIHGYDNGNFGPEDFLTRAQASKIIMNAFSQKSLQLPLSRESSSGKFNFPDIPNDHSLKLEMQKAFNFNIFKGYPDGNFRPNKYLSINEAFIITQRGKNLKSPNKKILKPDFGEKYFHGLVGVSRLKPARKTKIQLNFTEKNNSKIFSKNFDINVKKRNFETRSFNLPKPKTKLLTGTKKDNSWDMIFGAQKNSIPEKLWKGLFIFPTKGEKTLGYGNQLFINGKPSGSHFGHDYANEKGTKIWAANNGKIVLADWTPSYGNTVMIDHGQNVFTMYLHNSELKVKKGDFVKKGEIISLMGATGIATGPHLHYSHWVGDVIVDGEEWFKKEY